MPTVSTIFMRHPKNIKPALLARISYISAIAILIHWIKVDDGGYSPQPVDDVITPAPTPIPTETDFNYHPTFMIIGWLCFGSEALLAYHAFPGRLMAHGTSKAWSVAAPIAHIFAH